MKAKILSLLLLILLCGSVSAFNFEIDSISSPSKRPYQGDTIEFEGSIKASDKNFCHISCKWSNGQYNDKLISSDIAPNQRKPFKILLNTMGSNGKSSFTLVVTCKFVFGKTCAYSPSVTHSRGATIEFDYNGDRRCTTPKESCASAREDCKCSSQLECNPSSSRGSDEKGCATFCGNNRIESKFENCESCSSDVGKCEGVGCSSAIECEDNFCVHGRCSKKAYRIRDGFCDNNDGENCKNSGADCSCGPFKECSGTGVCKTYCGNGQCEPEEKGICKLDCDWCGDGVCSTKESCRSCIPDCGECEKTQEVEQVTKQIVEIKKEAEKSAVKTQETTKQINIIVSAGIFIIFVVILFWIIVKFMWRDEKTDSSVKGKYSKKGSKSKCPRCQSKVNKSQKYCGICGKKLK